MNYLSKYAEVAFLNVNNNLIEGISNQIPYEKPFKLSSLPEPFDKPDIVVFQELYRKEYIPIFKVLKRHSIPYIIVPHGELSVVAQKKKFFKKFLANNFIFNKIANNALAIQCLSKKEKDLTKMGRKKIIIPNGIHIPNINRVEKNLNDNGIKFVYIGRLDAYHKGLDLMLEAIKIKERLLLENQAKFFIYGPDGLGRKRFLEKIIKKLNISNIVTLCDPISGKEKSQVLLEANCFIQTSRFEGMPLGVLEAMSYGIPVLITEGTNFKDFVIDNNIGWAASNDSISIANAIEQVLTNKSTLHIKGTLAQSIVKSSYNWDEIAKCTIKLYKDLINYENF